MKQLLAVALMAAIASLVAAPADARSPHATREIRQLKAQLRHAHASIRRKSRALERRSQELARARAGLAQAATQIAALEATLSRQTTECGQSLTAARGPTELVRAVTQVDREVTYVQLLNPSSSREALIAQSAMNYISGHVTAPAYGYLNVVAGTPPAAMAESVLQAGAGICGHAALTYAAILHRFNIPVRSVQFYYPDGVSNHIADEAYYDGDWHYYDPTWGAFYADGDDVLSITEARNRPDAQSLLRQYDTLFWRWVERRQGVPELGRETDPATRVEIDKQPFPY